MKSREHVTTNGRAVFFAAMWDDLRNAALSHGWALALHGSLKSDMDIMAMPWDEHASSVDVMINQLCLCFTEAAQIEKMIKRSTDKPNNRVVYTLPIWADFYLDINVIEQVSIVCPFCQADGFDKIGLKNHLISYCRLYKETEFIY